MFLNSVTLSVFGVKFAVGVWTSIEDVPVRFVLYVLCLAPPLALAFVLIPLSIRLLVVTSKIELLKHRKAIKGTLLGTIRMCFFVFVSCSFSSFSQKCGCAKLCWR